MRTRCASHLGPHEGIAGGPEESAGDHHQLSVFDVAHPDEPAPVVVEVRRSEREEVDLTLECPGGQLREGRSGHREAFRAGLAEDMIQYQSRARVEPTELG